MLISIALLAIVGAALAYKAKFGLMPYCTSTTIDGIGDTCPNYFDCEPTDVGPFITVYYAVPYPAGHPCITGDDDEFFISCQGITQFASCQ